MKSSISVFIIDDWIPINKEFIDSDKYSQAINADDLYHLALNEDWKSLSNMQQLIKNIRTSEEYASGFISLYGFSNPEIALTSIEEGLSANVIIYDWQYGAEINHKISKECLLFLLDKTSAFIFIYSFIEPKLSSLLNEPVFNKFRDRFQLFLKDGEIPQSYTSEEFIYQYIVNLVSNQISIRINGVNIEFKSNNLLSNASDILYLQRIIGSKYFLDELPKIDFEVNEAGIEKILNDSGKFIFYNEREKILINPAELEGKYLETTYQKLSYVDVIKNFSIEILEDTLNRGFYVLKS